MKKLLSLFVVLCFSVPMSAQIIIEAYMPIEFQNPAFFQCPFQSVLCENDVPNYMVINDNLTEADFGEDLEIAYRYQVGPGKLESIRVWGVLITEGMGVPNKIISEPEEEGLDIRIRLYDELTWSSPVKALTFPLEFIAEGINPVVLSEITDVNINDVSLHLTLIQLDIPIPANLLGQIPQEGWFSTTRLNPIQYSKVDSPMLNYFLQAGTLFDREDMDPDNPPTLVKVIYENGKSMNEHELLQQQRDMDLKVILGQNAQKTDSWDPAPFQASFAMTQSSAIPIRNLSIVLALVLMVGFAWFRLR